MADTYSTTEARRKALRNGEEDPAVVAQRYLNIYRQMHIFPPERKEAFNKMLLELPPLVKNIIGTMPGGVMLQDYIDDLLQKNGMTSVERDETPAFNQEKSSEATVAKTNEGENAPVRAAPEVKAPETTARPIAAATLSLGENFAAELAAALAKVQTASVQTPPVAAQTETKATVSSGAPTIEFGQGFAVEFSKLMASVLEKQNISQKESLEKLTGDLTKTQLFLAKNLKESQDEQKQSLNELVKNILAFYRQEREEQRQEIGQICKTLAQNQTALSLSMGNNAQTEISQEENSTAQKMMDLFLESQKQFNTRLDKIEATTMNVAASNKTVDEAKLLKVIGDSQEKLIQTLTTLNLQNNTAQANNNANNIQINTPDNSAQMMALLDKIFSRQASGQKSLEAAIVKAIEAQGKIYGEIAERQIAEITKVLAQNLKGGQPVYVPVVTEAAVKQNSAEDKAIEVPVFQNVSSLPNNDEKEEVVEEIQNPEQADIYSEDKPVDEILPPKKKKKKKKKKKAEVSENTEVFTETATAEPKVNDNQETEHETADEDITSILPTEDFPEVNSESFDDVAKPTEENEYDGATENNDLVTEWSIPTEKKVPEENKFNRREAKTYQNFETAVKEQTKENNFADTDNTWQDDSDDWGFSKSNLSDKKEKNKEINTENKDEDFDDYYSMTAIGDNSYIGSSDLSVQPKDESEITPVVSQTIPINIKNIPLIYDDSDEDTDDPYQNSILKD